MQADKQSYFKYFGGNVGDWGDLNIYVYIPFNPII